MGRSVTSKSEIGLKRKWPQKKGVKTVVILSSPKEEGNQNYSDFGQFQIQIAIILGRVIGHFRWIQFMRILHYVLSAIPSNSRNFANFASFRLHMNMRKQTIKKEGQTLISDSTFEWNHNVGLCRRIYFIRVVVVRVPLSPSELFYASEKEAVFPSNLFDQSRSLAALHCLSFSPLAASRGIM